MLKWFHSLAELFFLLKETENILVIPSLGEGSQNASQLFQFVVLIVMISIQQICDSVLDELLSRFKK